jgi:hypothetical protein
MKAKTVLAALAAAAFLTLAGGAAAQAPAANPPAPATNLRATITAFDGKVLQVKDQTGKDLSVQVPDTLNVQVAKAFGVADIKPGMVLAVTTLSRPDGSVVALDVRPLGGNANLFSMPYDLAPGSQMNNAKVDSIAAVATTNGTQLMLNYGTGTVNALITPQTTMSQTAPGARTDLKPGETIFARVRMDGANIVAAGIEVSKDGVKPGQ